MTDSEKLDEILRLLRAKASTEPTQQSIGAVADAADLDSAYGNESIRKMPSAKYWQGDDFTGRTMSDCPSDFLKAFAKYKGACAYMNEKNADPEKAKYIGYDRKSAARALGWAARNEGKPQSQVEADPFDENRPGGPLF